MKLCDLFYASSFLILGVVQFYDQFIVIGDEASFQMISSIMCGLNECVFRSISFGDRDGPLGRYFILPVGTWHLSIAASC